MSRLNTIIDANIKENGNQEITGKTLNYVLNEIAKEVEQGGNVKADGAYPDLIAGDLVGRGESVPAEFSFRASGGKSIKDGRAYIKRIKGNSVVWNNLVDTRRYESGFTIIEGVKILQGHKYLLQRSAANVGLYLIPIVDGVEKYEMFLPDGEYAKIYTSQYTDTTDARVYAEEYCGACVIADLTKMFGAGNEPTTIDEYEARKPIVADEYAYNEGEVIHCNTESIKSVGDNAWDEQWRQGFYYEGEYISRDTQICSKNPIQVLPNESYCINQEQYYVWYYDKEMQFIGFDVKFNSDTFVTPSNAAYIHFNLEPPYGATYNHDIMITLVHSGWKQDTDAGYQPYWQDTLPLPIINKYFPQGMKLAGSAHDEIRFNKASGKWEYSKGKIKGVDLSTLDWWHNNEGRMVAVLANGVFNKVLDYEPANAICAQYPIETYIHVYTNNYGLALSYQEPYLYVTVFDSAYTDAATFKAAMQGVMLYYESNDWEWVELDAEDQNFRDYYNVADFGTEMSQSNVPSAAFSADIIYQFNAVDMIREHELEITELQSIIATMQAQLASLTNS